MGAESVRRQRTASPHTHAVLLSALLYALRRDGVVVSGVRRMSEVNVRRVRLVPGWVTVFGRIYDLGM